MSNSIDKQLNEFIAKLKGAGDVVLSEKVLKPILTETMDEIVTRTRKGSGVDANNKPKEKLKPLAAATKKSRAYKKSIGKLSGGTSVSKSNLTETSQMLDSIHLEFKGTKAIISPKGSRNNKVAFYVSKDRPFLFISRPEMKRLFKRIGDALLKLIK